MTIQASVNYHVKSSASQAFRFDVDGIAGNLIAPELIPTVVNVQDVRDRLGSVNFDDDGITFTHAPSAISTFNSNDWQVIYDKEIALLLKDRINAKEVMIFDHTLRVDDDNSVRKPARNVHNDYSATGAKQRLVDLVGHQQSAEFEQGAFGFVNVWRPVEHAITTSPLGFIRPCSMQPDDWMTIELIYPDRIGQILGVAANSEHEWFYQSDMQPNEVAIFNIYDNKGRPHLAHSALDTTMQADPPRSRKSIETRTLVRYA